MGRNEGGGQRFVVTALMAQSVNSGEGAAPATIGNFIAIGMQRIQPGSRRCQVSIGAQAEEGNHVSPTAGRERVAAVMTESIINKEAADVVYTLESVQVPFISP